MSTKKTHSVKAGWLANISGPNLIGKLVNTMAIGDWQGGPCEVTEVDPDPAAPEIVMNVRHLDGGDEIGVFEDEDIQLID
jgi:hypothetical protein